MNIRLVYWKIDIKKVIQVSLLLCFFSSSAFSQVVNVTLQLPNACTKKISITVNPDNSGIVEGLGDFVYGENIYLVAIPETGYNFLNWTENDIEVSSEENYSFFVTKDRQLVINLELQSFNISAAAIPSEGGSIEGVGTYDYGQSASLTAIASSSYIFVNWTENEIEVSDNDVLNINVTENRSFSANFTFASNIFDSDLENSYLLFPNPTNNKVSIKFDKLSVDKNSIHLFFFNEIGEQLEINNVNITNNLISFNLGNQSPGIYYIQLFISDEPVKTFKIIISL